MSKMFLYRYSVCLAATLVLLTGLAGCDRGKTVQSYELDPRARWAAYADRSYLVEQQRICFCPTVHDAVQLTVVDKTVTSGVDTRTGETLSARELSWHKSVDELFLFIDEAHSQNPAILDITYDSTFGYPDRVFIDQNLGMADEEIVYTTRLVKFLDE